MSAMAAAPRSLVLCGGGITGAMYEFGALHALDHACGGKFSSTQYDVYVGTSGGAVVAALMANGVTPAEVGRAILHIGRHVGGAHDEKPDIRPTGAQDELA